MQIDSHPQMESNSKVQFYQDIIKKAHDAFREFLTHLPEDILDWTIHESLNSVRWIVEHVIHDQMWIANVIMDNSEEGYHFEIRKSDNDSVGVLQKATILMNRQYPQLLHLENIRGIGQH